MATRVTRVVIAGGGIVGVPLAYAVKAKLHGKVDVTLVSDGSDFHFVPANPWVALGLRAAEDVTFALEPLLSARKIALQPDAVQSIDPERSRLGLAGGVELEYDYLVIATGIRPDWNGVPGAVGNPRVQSVIRPTDAVAAQAAYAEFLKHPGPGPVVVAAAPRVPTIGPMYEYAFLLDADLRRRALRERVPITLVTPEPYPGHVGLDKPVAREALTDALRREGIEWIGNAALERCEDRTLRFT
ncbi:MAG: NAD(P)/FAD-dependent oxidoreductase, partial [Steroidobacteraceae bacterium]